MSFNSRSQAIRGHSFVVALCLGLGLGFTSVSAAAQAQDTTKAPVKVYRGRIVGVFDQDTGLPIEGVEVRDVLTGFSAKTTETGTLSLFFVDTAGSFISFRKIGYEAVTMPLGNSLRDTSAVTVILAHSGQVLPTIVSKRTGTRGPADTVAKLDRMGYYDRRNSSAAPPSAFVTAEQVGKLTLVSDVQSITGRPICTENLYLDGVRVTATGSRGRTLRSNPVDNLVNASDVAAIETYRTSEIPAEYNKTGRAGGTASCATLIWTK